MDGSGSCTFGKVIGDVLSSSVSPVRDSFSLATPPISPACNSGTGWMVFPNRAPDVGQPFGAAGARVYQVGVVSYNPGDHLEVGHAARERIGDGLEDVDGNRLGVFLRALDFFPVQCSFPGQMFIRFGEVFQREVEDQFAADVVEA